MVTAKGAEIDTVVGLEVGADDYVTKPYRLRELVARMRAVLRRAPDKRRLGDGRTATDSRSTACRSTRSSTSVDGRRRSRCSLPLKEFELLHLLLANAGRVLPRETLIDRVWGHDYVGDTKTLDVHIKRLQGQDRNRPVAAGADHHHPRPRLQVRALRGTSVEDLGEGGEQGGHVALPRGVSHRADPPDLAGDGAEAAADLDAVVAEQPRAHLGFARARRAVRRESRSS